MESNLTLEAYSEDGTLVTISFSDEKSMSDFIENNTIMASDGYYELI